jgi:isoleucyl-tRNA synthetase
MVEGLRYDPRAVEEAVAKKWAEKNIVQKVFEANKEGRWFTFLEGPPTVNGYMHIGHTRGRVYKDIVLRFKTMQGYRVWRRAGWDCQGLPTEIEVEKRLNITSKRDIERIGLERFVEEAWRVVDHYLSRWRKDSEKLALWLDYENAYETRRDVYMEHVWYLLKKAYENGDLVESLRVVPVCPHCETALSQHELAQGYEEIADPSVYVKMPLKNGGYVVIWTTTPWTIPGNMAVAASPHAVYVELDVSGERWFVAEALLERFASETGLTDYRVTRRLFGRELVGMEYTHPLADFIPFHRDKTYHIVASEHVSLEEGTGFVHIAPAHGPEDFEIGRKHGLTIFCPVTQSGIFTEEGGRYAGLGVEEVSRMVITDLKNKNLLVKAGEIVHSYPHCWRCGTKLIYLASVQWFLRVERIRDKMVEGNKNVKWWPEWAGTNRFGDWLANAEDWCISRSKVWGTPLNVWRCESCGEKKVVGSREELEDAVEKPSVKRMHRPWVDMYVFKCGRCGGMMRRIPFVLDTWLDSGVAFYASVDALHNPSLFKTLFPYDFITEAIDQTRGWFYTLMFTSTLLYGTPPYKSVLNQGHVLDEFGKKMSKSRGNVVWAEEAFKRFGVDPLRLYLAGKAEPWSTINFVPSEVDQVAEALNILWNVFNFASTYMKLDGFDPVKHRLENYVGVLRSEDRWILSKVNKLVKDITASLEEMEIHHAVRMLLGFITEDLSRTYIRSVRRLAWTEAEMAEKMAAYACLHYVLKKVVLLLAPFTPYLSDMLYEDLRADGDPESVHLERWPQVDERFLDEKLISSMEVVRDILTSILAARQRAGRKLRSPVLNIAIVPRNLHTFEAVKTFEAFLKESSNTERLTVLEPDATFEGVRYVVEAELHKVGPRLGRRLPELLEYLKKCDTPALVEKLRREHRVSIPLPSGEVELGEDELVVKKTTAEEYSYAENPHAEVYVDLRTTPDLESTAAAREVVRRIQLMRKEAKLEMLDRIDCIIQADDPDFIQHLSTKKTYIEEETRASLTLSNLSPHPPEGYFVRDWEVEGVTVRIAFRRQSNKTYNHG